MTSAQDALQAAGAALESALFAGEDVLFVVGPALTATFDDSSPQRAHVQLERMWRLLGSYIATECADDDIERTFEDAHDPPPPIYHLQTNLRDPEHRPEAARAEAMQAAESVALVIVVGAEGVAPSLALLEAARARGVPIIEVAERDTAASPLCAHRLRGPLAEVLDALADAGAIP